MGGTCDTRFAAVEEAFEASFAAGLEVGAACAVVVDGTLVVDLWGGVADVRTGRRWERHTLVDCRSATKALTAVCHHLFVDRGQIDVDAPLRRWWPELRVDPTVRHALSHQAGVPVVDDLPPGALVDWDTVARAVERQEPMWEPGERHGYHGVTWGWLAGEPVRRLSGRTLGDVLGAEVLAPLGLERDCYLATPAPEHPRVAPLADGTDAQRALAAGADAPRRSEAIDPSLAQRMFAPVWPPIAPPMNSRRFWSAEIPVTGAHVTARTHATIFGDLARDGGRLLSPDTAAAVGTAEVDGIDAVLGVPVTRTLGFELTPAWETDSRPARCYGSPGGGGVLTFADPVARVGFAYLCNAAWAGPPGVDPRGTSLAAAVYRCL